MIRKSENFHELTSNSKKKSYSPLKVSMLGDLTQLTQGSRGGNDDAGSGRTGGNQGNPGNPGGGRP
jgi:hypothetical protein